MDPSRHLAPRVNFISTGRVVHPTQRRPLPDISQDWGSKKGERTESPSRYVQCAWGRAPTVQDLAVEDVLPRSRWVQGGWFTPLIGAPHPIYPRIGGRKRGSEQNRRHDMSHAPGVAPQLCESCGGGCINKVKMGTGKVVHPTQRCPPPDIFQDWGSKKREQTESPTRYVPCAWGHAPTVQDLAVEDVLPRSRWVHLSRAKWRIS